MQFNALATSVRVREATGTLMLRERSVALPSQYDCTSPGLLDHFRVWGQAFLIGPKVPLAWNKELAALFAEDHSVLYGVTVLPWERGIGIKTIGSEVRAVRHALHTAWNWLRVRRHLGAPAMILPK